MAFVRAAGYNNLPNGVFTPVIYSQKVLKFFRKVSVVEDITNTDYFGEIENFGDTVNIILEPVISVQPYQRGTVVTPQDLVDQQTQLIVDHANFFAFKVDDIEAKQAHTNWEALATSSGAYSIKDTFDSEVLTYISTQVDASNVLASTGTPQLVGFKPGSMSPLAVMNRAQRFLDINNVPTNERWFVADPEFWEVMGDENSRLMEAFFTGDAKSAVRNGLVLDGEIRGFKSYKSNNTPNDPSGNNAYRVALFGHMSSTASASQIAKTEVFRDPDSFADVVRGLHLYGRKVLRPHAVGAIFWQLN
jgi:hypothetical protein